MARPTLSRARRLGRRAGIAVFAALVTVPTAIWSIQIMRAVWAPPSGPAPVSCSAGLAGLLQAVERAQARARTEIGGERAALAAFRAALRPEWASRPALDELCASDRRLMGMLREIDGVRYAEEHAIRYEASALTAQRQRARALKQSLSAENPTTR